jgi:hypothetical protein
MHWLWRDPAQPAGGSRRARRSILMRLLRRFIRAEAGNFVVITALLMPALIGLTALAVEFGMGLLSRAENQRVADIAAFAGALEYSAGKSEAGMRDTALHAAGLNGIDAAAVSVALVPSPRGTGEAVHVRIRTTNTIVLGTILGASSDLLVAAESFAAIGSPGQPACVLALDGKQSGIILSGGTRLNANDCSVASNATISVPCGTTVAAQVVYYDTKAPSQGCNGITGPNGAPAKIEKGNTPDPLVNHPHVLAGTARLPQVAALTAPATPSLAAATPIEFSWGNNANVANQVKAAGCTATGTMPNWTVSCPNNGATLSIGAISVRDDARVQFDMGSTKPKTYLISGAITVGGSATIAFPDGTYRISRGIATEGAAKVSFGKGAFDIGPSASGCDYGNAGAHSICVGGGTTLSFAGPSSFTLAAGFHTGGGASLTLGQGTANRFALGPASNGNAISLGGGSTTIMADALGGNDTFRIKGHVNGGGGGSCFIVSAAPHHDIAGSFLASGAIILGAGVYTVDGSFLLGSNGGGSSMCGGSMVSVRAIDVTIVLSGKTTANAGNCTSQSFCIGAGYNNVVLRAPTTGATAGMAVIGPTDGKTQGASLTEGAGNASISGAFYFPTGPIVMSGGAGLGGGGTSCLQLVGARIELSGGASAASDCLGSGAGGASKRVVLVQ